VSASDAVAASDGSATRALSAVPKSVDDVIAAVRALKLETDYEPILRANHVDGSVVAMMQEDDLKDLGVISLGHRKKMATALGIQLKATPTAVAGPPLTVEERTLYAQPLSFTPSVSSQPRILAPPALTLLRRSAEPANGVDGDSSLPPSEERRPKRQRTPSKKEAGGGDADGERPRKRQHSEAKSAKKEKKEKKAPPSPRKKAVRAADAAEEDMDLGLEEGEDGAGGEDAPAAPTPRKKRSSSGPTPEKRAKKKKDKGKEKEKEKDIPEAPLGEEETQELLDLVLRILHVQQRPVSLAEIAYIATKSGLYKELQTARPKFDVAIARAIKSHITSRGRVALIAEKASEVYFLTKLGTRAGESLEEDARKTSGTVSTAPAICAVCGGANHIITCRDCVRGFHRKCMDITDEAAVDYTCPGCRRGATRKSSAPSSATAPTSAASTGSPSATTTAAPTAPVAASSPEGTLPMPLPLPPAPHEAAPPPPQPLHSFEAFGAPPDDSSALNDGGAMLASFGLH